MRVLLRVAYDGTNYCGWQIQPNGITIEEVLSKALEELYKEPIPMIGASRTDSGVHALGNVAVVDLHTRMPAEKVAYALNARLPEDIRIQESKEVPQDFHPRHTDCLKTYEYQIYHARFENPKTNRYMHFEYGKLDVELMQKACKYFIGTHDFTSFCSAGSQVEDKVRTITSLEVHEKDDVITIRVQGNGFLYNMVRILAGTLLKVGKGQIEPQEIPVILESKNRTQAGPTAPAKGLTLVRIVYPELGEAYSE